MTGFVGLVDFRINNVFSFTPEHAIEEFRRKCETHLLQRINFIVLILLENLELCVFVMYERIYLCFEDRMTAN